MLADMRAKATFYLKHVRAKLTGLELRLGFLVTALWLVLLAIYITRGKGWTALWSLDFNNMGDFLSGAFAPLAFAWLVIAVLLQTAELSLQREELHQSRRALEQQAKETRDLVEQNKLSVQVAQLRSREERLHQVIDSLALKVINLARLSEVKVAGNGANPFGGQDYLLRQAEAGGTRDAVFPGALTRIGNWLAYMRDVQGKNPGLPLPITPFPELEKDLRLLLDQFERIKVVLDKEPDLESVRARAYASDLFAFTDGVRRVLSVLTHETKP
jgi:hypothetical protein